MKGILFFVFEELNQFGAIKDCRRGPDLHMCCQEESYTSAWHVPKLDTGQDGHGPAPACQFPWSWICGSGVEEMERNRQEVEYLIAKRNISAVG